MYYFFQKIEVKLKQIKLSVFAQSAIVIVFLLGLSFITYHDTISNPPQGIHSWNQSDHYAIALGFVENDLNLFKPQSYILNPPAIAPSIDSLEGITRVDFPLFHYIVGICMKVTHCEAPFMQRTISLIISLIGLFFLFKTVKQHTQSFLSAFILTIFVFCLPIYLFYQCNFLPSVPGLALCFIGYYFYFNYLTSNKKIKYFIIGIIFFTLAILFRLPLGIAFLAVCCQQFLSYIIHKKIVWKEVFTIFLAFLLLAAYYTYNHFLGAKYGSIYLAGIVPASSWEEFCSLITRIKEVQGNHQINISITLFICILGLNFILFMLYSIIKKQSFSKFQKQLLIQASIALFGGFCYFILMVNQFVYHDYYFIDCIYLGSILFLFFFFSCFKWNFYINAIGKSALLIILYFIFVQSYHQNKESSTSGPEDFDYRVEQKVADIQYLLDKHHIGKDQLIFIMDYDLPENMAFCYLKRKGFCWVRFNQNSKWVAKADYIFSSAQNLENDIFRNDSTLKYKLNVVDRYGAMILFTRNTNPSDKSKIYEPIPENTSSLQIYELNFDSVPSAFWKIQDDVIFLNDSMRHVAHVLPDRRYTSTLYLPAKALLPPLSFKNALIQMDLMPLQNNLKINLVVTQNRDNKTVSRNSFPITEKDTGSWYKIQYLVNFRDINPEKDEFSLFLWNNNQSEFYYDNLKITFY